MTISSFYLDFHRFTWDFHRFTFDAVARGDGWCCTTEHDCFIRTRKGFRSLSAPLLGGISHLSNVLARFQGKKWTQSRPSTAIVRLFTGQVWRMR
jgi:hypothetical protein